MIERLLRHWYAAHAPAMPDSVWGGKPELERGDKAAIVYLAVVAWWRYEFANAMIEERRNRKPKR